jgi:hypothetical protein
VSDREEHERKQQPPYLDPSLLINTRLSEVERQQSEDRAEEKKHKSDQLAINKSLAIFTGLLFITSVVSDCILLYQTNITKESVNAAKAAADAATKAAGAASNQTDLLRQQMKTTLPASVRFNVGMVNQKIEISAQNYGHSIATKVGGSITIERSHLPDQKPIGMPISYEIVLPDLSPPPSPGEPDTSGTNHDYEIPGFTTADMEAAQRTEQTITVRATFSYEDGFSGTHRSAQCQSFLWTPMFTNIAGGQMAIRGFIECQQVGSALKTYDKYKKEQP